MTRYIWEVYFMPAAATNNWLSKLVDGVLTVTRGRPRFVHSFLRLIVFHPDGVEEALEVLSYGPWGLEAYPDLEALARNGVNLDELTRIEIVAKRPVPFGYWPLVQWADGAVSRPLRRFNLGFAWGSFLTLIGRRGDAWKYPVCTDLVSFAVWGNHFQGHLTPDELYDMVVRQRHLDWDGQIFETEW